VRIYLVRHGLALSKSEDPEKGLSDTGRKDVARVSDILEQTGAGVDHLYHSGKARARQTAEILAQSVLWDPQLETAGDLNPTDPVEPWIGKIEALDKDTMLVGHMPFMGKLASRLVTGSEDAELIQFTPGTVACLERTEKGGWVILSVTIPQF
jgi:phosphohistidine phosphatase